MDHEPICAGGSELALPSVPVCRNCGGAYIPWGPAGEKFVPREQPVVNATTPAEALAWKEHNERVAVLFNVRIGRIRFVALAEDLGGAET